MSLDYALAISCAFGALVILHIIDLRRRKLRLRQRIRALGKPIDASRTPPATNHPGTRSNDDGGDETAPGLYDRVIVLLLILALLWFAGRIWLEA